MNVLVTGAGGFVGAGLVNRLLSADTPFPALTSLTVMDQRLAELPKDSRVRAIEGDFGDPQRLREAMQTDVDLIFHLASIPGGLAEREFELGLQVNLHAMVELLEAARRSGRRPRFVFASTVGVYGVPMPSVVNESTPTEPTLSYGAHKLIGEVLVSDYSRRGFVNGCSLRLPGIIARPLQPSGLLSAFLSDAIRTLAAGNTFTFPVSAEGTAWLMSRPCVVNNLLHAATLDAAALKAQRVWLLPVLHASMRQIVAALARVHGKHVLDNVHYEPNGPLEAQFARCPPLECPSSLAAGFQNDGTLDALVQRALT